MNTLFRKILVLASVALAGCSQSEFKFASKNPDLINNTLGNPAADPMGPTSSAQPIQPLNPEGNQPKGPPLSPIEPPVVSNPPPPMNPPPPVAGNPPPPPVNPPPMNPPPPVNPPPVAGNPPPPPVNPPVDPPVYPPVAGDPPPSINPCDPDSDITLISKGDLDDVKKFTSTKDFDKKDEVSDHTDFKKRGRTENISEELINHYTQASSDDSSDYKLCVVDADDKKVVKNDRDEDHDKDHDKDHSKKHDKDKDDDDDNNIIKLCIGNAIDARADELAAHGFKGLNGKHKNRFMCCTEVVIEKDEDHDKDKDRDHDKDHPVAKDDDDHKSDDKDCDHHEDDDHSKGHGKDS